MKRILTILVAALAVYAGAQAPNQAIADLNKFVDDASKACPTKVSDSLTQTAVALAGKDLTFNWTVEQDDAFKQIKEQRDLVRSAKVAELSMYEPSDNQLVYFIKNANVDIVYKLANKLGTDTVTIRISPQDLE